MERARENRRASERKKENGGRGGDREAILSMRVTTARKRIWAVESGKSKWVKRTNGSADVGRRCDFCRRGWRSQVSSCKRRMCARTTSASFLCLFPPPPPPPPSPEVGIALEPLQGALDTPFTLHLPATRKSQEGSFYLCRFVADTLPVGVHRRCGYVEIEHELGLTDISRASPLLIGPTLVLASNSPQIAAFRSEWCRSVVQIQVKLGGFRG